MLQGGERVKPEGSQSEINAHCHCIDFHRQFLQPHLSGITGLVIAAMDIEKYGKVCFCSVRTIDVKSKAVFGPCISQRCLLEGRGARLFCIPYSLPGKRILRRFPALRSPVGDSIPCQDFSVPDAPDHAVLRRLQCVLPIRRYYRFRCLACTGRWAEPAGPRGSCRSGDSASATDVDKRVMTRDVNIFLLIFIVFPHFQSFRNSIFPTSYHTEKSVFCYDEGKPDSL